MFMLTNEQRECFALNPVLENWELIEAKASPYDNFKTYFFLEGDIIVKCIQQNDSKYIEYELHEKVSSDRKYLLPKTDKGKPSLLSSSTVLKRKGTGMCLFFLENYIDLYNENTECAYYNNVYLNDKNILTTEEFFKWVEKWCKETTDEDKVDVAHFSKQKRKHVKYKEGDVFRFKIDRRNYGYGRILLDYDKMRKNKEPFWDILMSKPLVCSVYHIITDRKDVSLEELEKLGSLPSSVVADNHLFYGESEIIGNLPIGDNEDYPIMYGNSIQMGEKAVCYQCGKFFKTTENETAIYNGFINNEVSFSFNLTKDVLKRCIEEKSNEPYWTSFNSHWVKGDLRNPENKEKLSEIRRQLEL